MTVWAPVVGQPEVVARLSAVAATGDRPGHAWLLTGPAGSGRSTAAKAFAAALQCAHGGCGQCVACREVVAEQAPDVSFVSTEAMTMDIATVRELVTLAHRSPGTYPYRVIVVQDADRMTERTGNVLLKVIEEPPPHTVWLLCAPSPQDVLATIRSRCQQVRLRMPDPGEVAQFLVAELGVSVEAAAVAAAASQSHIGVARRLLTDPAAKDLRDKVTRAVFEVQGVGGALRSAKWLHDAAQDAAATSLAERNAAEKESLLRALGVDSGGKVPPALRTQIRRLEEDQKRRGTRVQADVLDRALIDVESVFRDVLVTQFGAASALVNQHVADHVRRRAGECTPVATLRQLDAVAKTRRRVVGPVMLNRLLALEAMFVRICHP